MTLDNACKKKFESMDMYRHAVQMKNPEIRSLRVLLHFYDSVGFLSLSLLRIFEFANGGDDIDEKHQKRKAVGAPDKSAISAH